MKRVYLPFERHTQGAAVFVDGDGCIYLKPHGHPLFVGREFANELEFNQFVADHRAELSGAEIILLPVITIA